MHERPRYKGKLARTIPRDEAKAKGPVVFVERLRLLAEHYGIDHQNRPFNEWMAALALALAAAHVPGIRYEGDDVAQEADEEPKRGSAPRTRDKRIYESRIQDYVILKAVEEFMREREPKYIGETGRKRYSNRTAYKDFAKFVRSARGRSTPAPLPEGLPVAKLLSGLGGSTEQKLRGAGDRAKARRKIAAELNDTPIARLFHEMLGSEKRGD